MLPLSTLSERSAKRKDARRHLANLRVIPSATSLVIDLSEITGATPEQATANRQAAIKSLIASAR